MIIGFFLLLKLFYFFKQLIALKAICIKYKSLTILLNALLSVKSYFISHILSVRVPTY